MQLVVVILGDLIVVAPRGAPLAPLDVLRHATEGRHPSEGWFQREGFSISRPGRSRTTWPRGLKTPMEREECPVG